MALVDVVIVGCGAPKRSMGWYHGKQLLEERVAGARLTDVVEPFLLGPGKDSPAAKEFAAWAAGPAKAVRIHGTVAELPKPSASAVLLICGRTADNPRLFKEAVDSGFRNIYLEKPGAPTVGELEAMAAYAREHSTSVFLGYNRNFSKYVRHAHQFLASAPAGSSLRLARKDCFNTQESLDECFERNSEGMMKNMMCHELMVLITYYGLNVASVADVVADKEYTCSEVRCGFKDFSRVGFTIKTKGGRDLIIRGDRSGGEYAEAVVISDEKELFKAVRPDPEIMAAADELEKEEPGCMPYFYLQDGEYLALKKQVVDHISQGAAGRPEGVASIEDAIEGLKLCDHITAYLVAGSPDVLPGA